MLIPGVAAVVGILGPGQDCQGWPLLPPPGGLGLVDVAGCQHRVGPDDEIEHVPKPVIQASRDQVPVRKSQRSCPGQHLDQRGVARHRRPEASQLLIEGKPAETHQTVYHYSPRTTITASTPAASGSVRVSFQAVCCRCKASRASERCPNGAVHTLVYTDLHNGTARAR